MTAYTYQTNADGVEVRIPRPRPRPGSHRQKYWFGRRLRVSLVIEDARDGHWQWWMRATLRTAPLDRTRPDRWHALSCSRHGRDRDFHVERARNQT